MGRKNSGGENARKSFGSSVVNKLVNFVLKVAIRFKKEKLHWLVGYGLLSLTEKRNFPQIGMIMAHMVSVMGFLCLKSTSESKMERLKQKQCVSPLIPFILFHQYYRYTRDFVVAKNLSEKLRFEKFQ